MKTFLKTGLLLFTMAISQMTWAQDKTVKSFMKTHKSAPDATYVMARNGKEINFNDSGMEGIADLLGNIGSVKMITLNISSKVKADFKRLKSKLRQRYETMISLNDDDGGVYVYTDEDNGYLYALVQGDDEIIVVSLETN